MAPVLERLAELVRSDDPLLACAIDDRGGSLPAPRADQLRSGPRCQRHRSDLELVLESVHEGYLLHHGTPRVMRSDDPDLALLAGDRLYALGLELLAQAEDVASVRSLSEAIALCAHAHAADSPSLADAVWEATTSELGWGVTPELSRAKASARAGAPEAETQLRAAAAAARSVAAR